jgi:hypothetical protein
MPLVELCVAPERDAHNLGTQNNDVYGVVRDRVIGQAVRHGVGCDRASARWGVAPAPRRPSRTCEASSPSKRPTPALSPLFFLRAEASQAV